MCTKLKDYNLILAYEPIMTHKAAAEQPTRPLSAASRRSSWAHRTPYACWTIERLEHVELVAAPYSIRGAAPSSALINYNSKPISHASSFHIAQSYIGFAKALADQPNNY